MTTLAPTTPSPTAQGFAPRRLAHANLFVSDLDRSVAFYRDVCGLDPVFEEAGIKAVFLSNGSSHHDVALMEITEGERVGRDGHVQVSRGRGREPGLNHLGWEMQSEAALVQGIHAVRDAGVRLHRTVDHQISHSAYLFDPDGTYLEMYCDSTPDWRATYEQNTGQLITGAWDPDAAPPSTAELFAADPEFTVVRDSALHARRTARATVRVSDLDRSVDFYRAVAGLRLLRRGAGGAVLGGTLGLPDLTLLESPVPGLAHVGLEVAELGELVAGLERAARAGVVPVAEVDSAYKRSIVLRDPDGLLVEFLVPGPAAAADCVEEPSSARPFAL